MLGVAARPFYGWNLLAVVWLAMLFNAVMPMYAGSVLNSLMARRLHLSATQLGVIFTVYMLMSGLPSLGVARIINPWRL